MYLHTHIHKCSIRSSHYHHPIFAIIYYYKELGGEEGNRKELCGFFSASCRNGTTNGTDRSIREPWICLTLPTSFKGLPFLKRKGFEHLYQLCSSIINYCWWLGWWCLWFVYLFLPSSSILDPKSLSVLTIDNKKDLGVSWNPLVI